MRATRWLVLGCLLWPGSGCALGGEDEKQSDGSRCDDGKDCKSGYCTTDELCAPSSCDCNGDSCPADGGASKDCDSKRVCVTSTSIVESIGMAFSGDSDNDGYCELPCAAGCPEHHTCNGRFCEPDAGWANPVPSIAWTGATEGMLSGKNANMTYDLEPGKTVSLVASATSPSGIDISTFKWIIYDDNGVSDMVAGTNLDIGIEPEHSFVRADLTVVDAKMRSETLSISFQACLGVGHTCGYQGSGCCSKTCDSAANTCQ